MATSGYSSAAAPVQPSAQPSARTGISVFHFLLLAAQLGALLVVLRQFQIESGAFVRLAALGFGAALLHAILPLRLRLPFFVAASFAGLVLVMGPANAAWIVALGLVLIGLCHLPLAFAVRVGLIVAAAALLAAQRAGWLPQPWSEAIWPIFGAMFMFRLIVYLYDLRHDKVPGTPLQALAYFFMLPNACFPLFPVVDYKAFRRCHFDDDAYRTYQVGVDWMLRGVVHLLLYRLIYMHFTLAPSEVADPATLGQYLIANFLLYLRVSGLFHLVIGLLYLFGFRLSETHNRYLLAASFTDFWRRINIYWKDFMQKVFYYPAVFRLKHLGTTPALVIATLYVFVMTWFLHAYQWFWLRGTVLFVAQDILFWTLLGGLVVLNSLYEIRYGRKRRVASGGRDVRSFALRVLKTYATFWFICVLWSFWTCESIAEWAALWPALGGPLDAGALIWPLLILVVIVIGSIPQDGLRNLKLSGVSSEDWVRSRAATVVGLVLLIALGLEDVARRVHPDLASFVHTLRSGQLSRLDVAKLEQGYYENLLSVDRFNSQLWEVYSKKPQNWLDIDFANVKRFVPGFAQAELIPSVVARTDHGTITTNAWGMRDREYELSRTPGSFRAVVLGASSVMGWGVGDGETFEALVEARLNAEAAGGEVTRYELLNMAVPGYQPPQQLVAAERAATYAPDALFYVATGRELTRAANYLIEAVRKDLPIPYPALNELVARAGLSSTLEESEAKRRLAEHADALLGAVYAGIVERARAAGATPVWIFLPQVRPGSWSEETDEAMALAAQAGFEVISLADVYAGVAVESIRLAEWDDHPNRAGHRLIADRLYRELLARAGTVLRPATRAD